MAAGQETIAGATVEATDALKGLVQEQLREAGVGDASQRSERLQEQFARVVSASAERVADEASDPFDLGELLAALERLGSATNWFTIGEFAQAAGISESRAKLGIAALIKASMVMDRLDPDPDHPDQTTYMVRSIDANPLVRQLRQSGRSSSRP